MFQSIQKVQPTHTEHIVRAYEVFSWNGLRHCESSPSLVQLCMLIISKSIGVTRHCFETIPSIDAIFMGYLLGGSPGVINED